MAQEHAQQIRFTWNIHYACNFRCSYCFFEGKWQDYGKRTVYLSVNEWMEYWMRIYEKYGRCYMLITGGEPFTYPHFIELMIRLSEIHYPINISSNASGDLEFFVSSVDPKKVSLSVSFQPEYENLESFLRKVKFLKKNKFDGCINFLAYPPYIKDIGYYRKKFASAEANLKIIPFWGQYQGIDYPFGYTQEEKELLAIDADWENKVRKKGSLCIAGQKAALIFPDGKVARCGQIGEEMLIGNFFDPEFKLLEKPLPCIAEACPCDEGIIWPEEDQACRLSGLEEDAQLSVASFYEGYNKEDIENKLEELNILISQKDYKNRDSQLLWQKLKVIRSQISQLPILKHEDLFWQYTNIMRRLSQENTNLNNQEFQMRKISLKSYPRAVFLQFAGPCNSSCVFCSRGHDYEYFDLLKFQEKIESKIGYGLSQAERFIFTGSGEFLRLSKWNEILDYFDLNYQHIEKMFSTNGTSLQAEVCEKITRQKSKYVIHVSLHASNHKLHRVITRMNNFHTILDQVKHLLELHKKSGNVEVNFIFVANILNIEDLPDFLRLAKNIGVNKVVVYYNFIYVPAQKYLSCFFKPELTNRMFDVARELAKDLSIDLELPARFSLKEYRVVNKCSELWTQIMFNENGQVLPCDASIDCDVRLNDNTYEDVWNSDYYLQARREMVEQGHTECFRHCHRANPASVNIFSAHVIHRGRKDEEIDLFWAEKFSGSDTEKKIEFSKEEKSDFVKSAYQNIGEIEQRDIRFTWDIHYKCNFRCPYCWFYKKWSPESRRNIYLLPEEWMLHWKRVYEKYGTVRIEITGGEPFIYPNFIELIKLLSYIHAVKITTNMSGDIETFVKEIAPKRVDLDLNFHPLFADTEIFIKKTLLLKNAGFKAGVCYLAYPPQMKRIDMFRKRFEAIGINFALAAFWGEYQGKRYPQSYTEEEKNLIRPFLGDIDRIAYHLDAESPKGKLCNAGYKYAIAQADGNVVRCGPLADKFIGNFMDEDFHLFKQPIPCAADFCPCNEYVNLI